MKITFGDKIKGIIDMVSNKVTSFTGSDDFSKKKFSDVVEYVRAGKIAKALVGGRVSRDSDNGFHFYYDYESKAVTYRVTIHHRGEQITHFELFKRCTAATVQVKETINIMLKNIPDFEGNLEEIPAAPVVDYSQNSLSELVDLFDQKLQAFSKNATTAVLMELDTIKNAMADKVNAKPLAERAPFNKALGNITTYVDAMKTQANSGVDIAQFAGTYVSQMSASLAELAGLL